MCKMLKFLKILDKNIGRWYNPHIKGYEKDAFDRFCAQRAGGLRAGGKRPSGHHFGAGCPMRTARRRSVRGAGFVRIRKWRIAQFEWYRGNFFVSMGKDPVRRFLFFKKEVILCQGTMWISR